MLPDGSLVGSSRGTKCCATLAEDSRLPAVPEGFVEAGRPFSLPPPVEVRDGGVEVPPTFGSSISIRWYVGCVPSDKDTVGPGEAGK